MGRSVLLQLARDSIQEVLQSSRSIDKIALLDEHPLLSSKISTTVNIYINNKLRGTSSSKNASLSLIEDIILNAKKSAFEDKNFTPLSTSQYLECEIEILLNTDEGVISEKDPAILKTTTYSLEKELDN